MARTLDCRFRANVAGLLAGVVCLVLPVSAQQGPQAVPAPQTPVKLVEPARGVEQIKLTAGRSTVLTTDYDIRRIAVTNPAVADAVVVQPREVLIDGKGTGTVSLIVWGEARRFQYDIVVEPAITTLQQQLQALFPGEDIRISASDDALVLSGQVSSTAVMMKAGEIAQASASKNKVINLLQLPGGSESQQVMLQVRFAEVNRRAVRELGANFFVGGYKNWFYRGTTGQFTAPNIDPTGGTTLSDLLNLFVFNSKYNMGVVIRAFQDRGYFQSLAEPNLIAYNGQEASFLAGGEYPVPVVQGLTGAVSVQFKEYGIRLRFKPTIAGDVIRLHVRPEVSALDFNNGVSLGGYRIPALTTRWAETEVELRDGQSFAIAGLLDNLTQEDNQNVPLLSSIPIIGYLFKSQAKRQERTELMVLVTPQLVRPLEPDEVPPLPTQPGRFLKPGGEVGSQLEGGGGVVDAPPAKPGEKPTTPPIKKD
jgi:pilus assembly protein CpaC